MRRYFCLLILFLGACDCGSPALRRSLPPDVRVDSHQQQAASKVDVLWVVDNSESMEPRQTNLAKSFQSFIDLFTRGTIDYRIAITTTDIAKDEGKFRGTPAVLSPKTPNVTEAFAKNIKVGITGSSYEVGFQAAELALSRQSAENAPKYAALDSCRGNCSKAPDAVRCQEECFEKNPVEFLRQDAYLYLIFVTDEEDRSERDIRYYYRVFEGANGIGNDGTVTTAAIIGDVPSNTCGATPGSRYAELSALTGGELGSVCEDDFSKTLRKLAENAVGLRRKFALSNPPNPDTIEVFIHYPCNVSADVIKPCQTIDRTLCEGNPADSYNLICSPPKGGPDGWEYEAATSRVFFSGASVPWLNGRVEIQYYEEGKSP